jgi:hypothetical protein
MTNIQSTDEFAGRHLTLVQRLIIYVPASVLTVLAIIVGVFKPYTPGSDFGYWLGLVGGCMMLSLFLYPIRKYWQPAQRFGSLRAWFMIHIIFGICGPVLVLFHSSFQTKSINATFALWFMILVVISGLVGRFVYVHMYQGLDGSQATLRDLEENLKHRAEDAQHGLNLVPRVREMLLEYSRHVFATRELAWGKALSFLAIGWQGERLRARCESAITNALKAEARVNKWPRSKFQSEKDKLFELVDDYIRAIDTTGRYAYWESMLAWWHLIHVPLVYLLLASGIVHVFAVHMY